MALGAVIAAVALAGCGAAPEEPPQPPSSSPIPSVSASPTESPTPTPTPTRALAGLTLRQLGFNNGPLDEFSLPSNLQISTRVDQPNVVTIVLASPSPELIEDYLRATLPQEGFTIDARAAAGQAMTFAGHGWTGGFTGTGANSAVVLRPR
ncbi:hypothetical protein MLP_13480 [Microlunatus phosphovorus NM-1]|uniref:Uncharacterized protein n=2 Tax=Microlunatus phosphovorus TaxID=29405 RepID=F5XPQ4_MICPN|nr:hypothetical protein MLP_13480 [Microlunatus phosphovorus NM-1]